MRFAGCPTMNRRSLIALSLLLPLSACVDAVDADEDIDSSADALSAFTLSDAALELDGKIVGRLIEATGDPAVGGVTTRFDVREASALLDLFVANVAGSRSEPVDMIMTGYDAEGALQKLAITGARPTGVIMVATLETDQTIRLELELTWSGTDVQCGPAQGGAPGVPPAKPLNVGWELSDVPVGGLASVTVAAQKAKGWQKSYFDPIGVPGGVPPAAASKAGLTLTTTDDSGHCHELSISGSWGEITWTDTAPPAWTSHVVGDGLTTR